MGDSGSDCTCRRRSRRILSWWISWYELQCCRSIRSHARPLANPAFSPTLLTYVPAELFSDLFLSHRAEYREVVIRLTDGFQHQVAANEMPVPAIRLNCRSERTHVSCSSRFPCCLSHLSATEKPVSELSIGSGFAAAGCSSVDRRLILSGYSLRSAFPTTFAASVVNRAATYPPTDGLSSSAI